MLREEISKLLINLDDEQFVGVYKHLKKFNRNYKLRLARKPIKILKKEILELFKTLNDDEFAKVYKHIKKYKIEEVEITPPKEKKIQLSEKERQLKGKEYFKMYGEKWRQAHPLYYKSTLLRTKLEQGSAAILAELDVKEFITHQELLKILNVKSAKMIINPLIEKGEIRRIKGRVVCYTKSKDLVVEKTLEQRILDLLKENGKMPLQDIAKHLDVTPHNAIMRLATLVKKEKVFKLRLGNSFYSLDKIESVGILELLQKNGQMTSNEMAAHIGVSDVTVTRNIKQYLENGEVEKEKIGHNVYYRLK